MSVSHFLPKNPYVPAKKTERIVQNHNFTQNDILNHKLNLTKNHNVRVQNQLSGLMPKRTDLEKRDVVNFQEAVQVHRQKSNNFLTNNRNNFSIQINPNKIVHKKVEG